MYLSKIVMRFLFFFVSTNDPLDAVCNLWPLQSVDNIFGRGVENFLELPVVYLASSEPTNKLIVK